MLAIHSQRRRFPYDISDFSRSYRWKEDSKSNGKLEERNGISKEELEEE